MIFVNQHGEAVGQGEFLVGDIHVGRRKTAGEQNESEEGATV
jgi:hypothetical protein